MATKLFVGNLSWGVTDQQLNELFAQHGEVLSAQVITDRATGRSKGFGFVEMNTQEQADAAIAALSGQQYDGRPLTVNVAKPREERPAGSFGGGRGGFGGGRGQGGGRGGRY